MEAYLLPLRIYWVYLPEKAKDSWFDIFLPDYWQQKSIADTIPGLSISNYFSFSSKLSMGSSKN
jgi:hypothetical protein